MNIPVRILLGAALAAALFVSFPVARAAMAPGAGNDDQTPAVVASIPVPSGLAPGNIKNAVLEALTYRKWTAQEAAAGRITATYSRGSMSLTLAISYDSREVKVVVAQWDSRPRVQKTQERWFANAKKDIAEALIRQAALTK